jgi:large subunit ribosomal protein L32
MAVPKRRQSKARSKKRRSHNAVKPVQLGRCSECQRNTPTHTICPNCGYYQGHAVVESEE